MTMAAGDPATASGCRDVDTIADDRLAMQHHIPPIDQQRRRVPCRRCRRIREADNRFDAGSVIMGGRLILIGGCGRE